MGGDWYVAQVCANGHVISSLLESGGSKSAFCESCGVATTTVCENCGVALRGRYRSPEGVLADYVVPAFCYACGSSFPWTRERLDAARELVSDMGKLSEKEKVELSGTFGDLVADTPRTPVAVGRFRRLVEKAGPVAGKALYSVLVDVASEAVRKELFGR